MGKVIIYSDGACKNNPGPGGWGAVLLYAGQIKEISDGVELTTNNRMELTAAIEALRSLKKTCEIDFYTDSKYLQNGITDWIVQLETQWLANIQQSQVKNKISGRSSTGWSNCIRFHGIGPRVTPGTGATNVHTDLRRLRCASYWSERKPLANRSQLGLLLTRITNVPRRDWCRSIGAGTRCSGIYDPAKHGPRELTWGETRTTSQGPGGRDIAGISRGTGPLFQVACS